MENEIKVTEETVKQKKSNLKTIFLVIIGIILVGLSYAGGWYVGKEFASYEDKKTEEKDNNSNKKEEDTKEEKQEENTVKEISIETTKVKTAYDIIPHIDGLTEMKNAYQSKKTDVNNLDNELLLAFAFLKTEFTAENTYPMKGLEEEYDPEYIEDCWYSFKPEVIQATAKKLYNKELENQTASIQKEESITYKDGEYTYTYGGNGFIRTTNVREIVKAYEDEKYLYIEDKYAYIYNNFENEETKIYGVYKNSDKKNRRTERTKDESKEEIIKNHKDKMQSYKHTFAKNVDGTYYWVSTEPIA